MRLDRRHAEFTDEDAENQDTIVTASRDTVVTASQEMVVKAQPAWRIRPAAAAARRDVPELAGRLEGGQHGRGSRFVSGSVPRSVRRRVPRPAAQPADLVLPDLRDH